MMKATRGTRANAAAAAATVAPPPAPAPAPVVVGVSSSSPLSVCSSPLSASPPAKRKRKRGRANLHHSKSHRAAALAVTAGPQIPRFKFTNKVKFPSAADRPAYALAFNLVDPRYKEYCAVGIGHLVAVFHCLSSPLGLMDCIACWSESDPAEYCYTLAWTVHVITGEPLLVVAGESGIIKVINVFTKRVINKLIGHTAAINEIRVHPRHPMLLLSASRDNSLRLWHIGLCDYYYTKHKQSAGPEHTPVEIDEYFLVESSPPPSSSSPPPAPVSVTNCLAIYSGEGGHRDEVLSCDWHASGELIISSGMDHNVNIWEVDPLIQSYIREDYERAIVEQEEYKRQWKESQNDNGEADTQTNANAQQQTPTSPTQTDSSKSRPRFRFSAFPSSTHLYQFPIFSTNRIHENYVDHIRFYGDFILSKSTTESIVLWKCRLDAKQSKKNLPVPLQVFSFNECDIWYIRFHVSISRENGCFLIVGNKIGNIFIWKLNEDDDEQTNAGAANEAAEAAPAQSASPAPPSSGPAPPVPRVLSCPQSIRAVRCVSLSADGSMLIAATEDGAIVRWDEIKR